MNKTIIAVVVLIIVGLGTYYFVFSARSTGQNPYSAPADQSAQQPAQQPAQTPPSSNPPAQTPTQAPATTASVNIAGFAFSPATLNVKVGTTVTWTNNDTVSHTVVSDNGGPLNTKNIISPGQTFSFTFTNAGTFPYHCSIHPSMKGKVVVTS